MLIATILKKSSSSGCSRNYVCRRMRRRLRLLPVGRSCKRPDHSDAPPFKRRRAKGDRGDRLRPGFAGSKPSELITRANPDPAAQSMTYLGGCVGSQRVAADPKDRISRCLVPCGCLATSPRRSGLPIVACPDSPRFPRSCKPSWTLSSRSSAGLRAPHVEWQ